MNFQTSQGTELPSLQISEREIHNLKIEQFGLFSSDLMDNGGILLIISGLQLLAVPISLAGIMILQKKSSYFMILRNKVQRWIFSNFVVSKTWLILVTTQIELLMCTGFTFLIQE